MPGKPIRIKGMPFVPGVTHGVLPVLLGLGYRAFSVDAAQVPYLAQTIQTTRITEAEQLAQQVCNARKTQQVLELLSLQVES